MRVLKRNMSRYDALPDVVDNFQLIRVRVKYRVNRLRNKLQADLLYLADHEKYGFGCMLLKGYALPGHNLT